MRLPLLASAMMVALLMSGACQGRRVGGPCTYEEFEGRCVMSGKNGNAQSLFTFIGTVRGTEVTLEGNIAAHSLPQGSTQRCFLRFISRGTCTPCLLSIGSCGKSAWELFRAQGVK